MRINIFSVFSRKRNRSATNTAGNTNNFEAAQANLAFDELNPLLAKQLSEMEAQIGQLAQVQFQLAEERQKMRFEMEALKKAMQDSQGTVSITTDSITTNSQINSENETT